MNAPAPGHCLLVYRSPILSESRLLRMAGAMNASGLFDECHIVGCAGPDLPREERPEPGIVIARVGEPRSRAGGWRADLAASWHWSSSVLRRYRKTHITVVCAHSVAALPLCWLMARLHHCLLVYNPHELESRTLSMRGLRGRLAQLVERLFIGRAAVVSTVNESISDWYAATFPIARPVSVRNLPIPGAGDLDLRSVIGVGDTELLFVHTGNLVGGRNIDLILKTFQDLPDESTAHLVFLGDGPLKSDVLAAAGRSGRIHWLPPVYPTAVVDAVAQADVAFAMIDPVSDSNRFASPNKLFEALTASVPPICTNLVEARKLLGPEADRWILLDPQSDLAPLVQEITRDDVRRFRQLVPPLGTWEDEVAPLIERLEETLRDPIVAFRLARTRKG